MIIPIARPGGAALCPPSTASARLAPVARAARRLPQPQIRRWATRASSGDEADSSSDAADGAGGGGSELERLSQLRQQAARFNELFFGADAFSGVELEEQEEQEAADEGSSREGGRVHRDGECSTPCAGAPGQHSVAGMLALSCASPWPPAPCHCSAPVARAVGGAARHARGATRACAALHLHV